MFDRLKSLQDMPPWAQYTAYWVFVGAVLVVVLAATDSIGVFWEAVVAIHDWLLVLGLVVAIAVAAEAAHLHRRTEAELEAADAEIARLLDDRRRRRGVVRLPGRHDLPSGA